MTSGIDAAGGIPGHIRKAFKSIDRFLPVVDIVIELLDSRMPFSSRIQGLVARLEKTSLLVFGKADLAEPRKTKEWMTWFENHGQPCATFRTDDPQSGKALVEKIRTMAKETISPTRKVRRMMIVGIPNVGKSTLINVLAGRKAARVANLPGVTRNIQWIKLPGELELLDLPGILDFSLLRRGNVLRLINTLPGPDDDPIESAGLLAKLLKEAGLSQHIPHLATTVGLESFLEAYSKELNFIGKGSTPDLRRAALDVLKKFQKGVFGPLTLETPDMLESLENKALPA